MIEFFLTKSKSRRLLVGQEESQESGAQERSGSVLLLRFTYVNMINEETVAVDELYYP